MLAAVGPGPEVGPAAVCAGFPGERHDLGLLYAAVHAAVRGHRVTWLGADVPLADLLAFLRDKPTRVACTSVVISA